MIKEIAVVTNEDSYRCVRTLPEDVADKYQLTVATTTIKPDTFVDDDYKADWEIVSRLLNTCKENGSEETLHIKRTIPPNTSKIEHYTNIMEEAHEVAQMKIYMNTKRFMPNFIIASSDISPILAFNPDDYRRNPDMPHEGTVVWGWYKDIPVLVSYSLKHNEMIWGVNNEVTPGIVAFTKDDKVCYKIANPSSFVYIKLEDE
jgi:hypothetical protein